uniref:Family with sequence similarity 83 member G n=1 Tax=Lates calcarifer TaxID=8187 RepID=A0A4W6BXU4_LATCA
MALSQIQCLDDNHVNPRTNESKPEFLYCEDQRLALEALLRDGREAFAKYLQARGLRGFLSEPELETLAGAVEPYDPGLELFPESAEDDDPPLSQHYWPDLSDTSIPQMDLGWPDSESYRGVTRTTVYTQPPLDGQAHIKEIVRKMIAQAQKVIAVVMDVFTDVDIFRDLLDAGFKRRVSIYILLERTALPHFLSMCQRHLRVRCTEGSEFHTRSCTKVRGKMGHRFMFVDGDKAVSGSYRSVFTWLSSRLDINLITVVTGQAVDAFDRLFRVLYVTSSFVNLRQVAAAVTVPSAAIARKLYNPKYALVAAGNPSPTPSADRQQPQRAPKFKELQEHRGPRRQEEEPGDIKTKGEAPEQTSSPSGQKSEPDKDTTKVLNTENKLHSNTPTNQDAGHNTSPQQNGHTPSQSSSKTSTPPNTGPPSHTTQTVATDSPKSQSIPGSNTEKGAETGCCCEQVTTPWS